MMAAILSAGDLFDSFDEVEKVMKEYERASFVNFYISDSRSIGAAANKAPRITEKARKELKYHRLVYACIHGGRKFVSKSKGRRKMSTFKQECPVKVRFGLSSDGQHLVLIELNENHNHAVTQASFVHLPRQRKLDDDEKTEATMLMDMKINKQVIQEHLQSKTGKVITLRDLHNIRHQRSKCDKQNELEAVVQLLQTTEGSIVEVAITEDSCLVGIYYQEADMQKTFAEFPELLVIDSTNRLTDLNMQLYVLMVVDGNCRSEVVATFLSANNTCDTFRHVIQTFMLHNAAYESIRAVMTDKDANELQVLREEFPNASLEDEFVESFKGSHALSENRSIDKLESVNEKIKVVCSRNTTLTPFYKELLTALHSLAVERNHQAMQTFLKKPPCIFPADSPSASYFQILTPHAFSLLKSHLDTYNVVHIVRDIDDIACELSTSMGRMVTTLDACPCVFRRSTGLPCRHIMAVRSIKHYCIFDRTLVPDRWTRYYNASQNNEALNGTVEQLVVADSQPQQPSAGVLARSDKPKVQSAEVRRRRAADLADELVKLVAEAPESHYATRLKQMKKLRDTWLAEMIVSEDQGLATERETVNNSAVSLTDGGNAKGTVVIGGFDVCDVDTVGETELIDIANNICYGLSGTVDDQGMKYSDIKLPGKVGKRGRPNGADKAAAGLPKKRSKVVL